MIITKRMLPRRTVLRGIGATLALPFLDAMTPALASQAQKPGVAFRLGFFYMPNGVFLPSFHPAGEGGTDFELTPILNPMTPFRDQLVVVSGLSNKMAENLNEGNGPHTRVHAAWLNGARPKRTEGADIHAGKTIDQFAADKLGADTQLRSLELTTEEGFLVGNCDNGYSCAYKNSTSWRSATQPLPHEPNPRIVFERLFGDGDSGPARRSALQTDRSILDSVAEAMKSLRAKLGPDDNVMVGEYFDAIRDVERRIHKAEQLSEASLVPEIKPVGIPDSFDEYVKLLLELQFLAYRADVTRVATFQIARESSNRTYPEIGVPEGHHSVSHHQYNAQMIAQNTRINAYHMSLVAWLAEKMRHTPDGDGTLLDHAVLMAGCGMGDGDLHTPVNMPTTLVGGGCGSLKGGRHLKYELDTPAMNLGLSLLDKVGVHLESLGDSTGRLADL